jgi:tetratricopeptide (TPR) repeat protein
LNRSNRDTEARPDRGKCRDYYGLNLLSLIDTGDGNSIHLPDSIVGLSQGCHNNRAIELKPDLAEAYYNRGIAWVKKGNFDRAIEDVKKACKLGLQPACNLLRKLPK